MRNEVQIGTKLGSGEKPFRPCHSQTIRKRLENSVFEVGKRLWNSQLLFVSFMTTGMDSATNGAAFAARPILTLDDFVVGGVVADSFEIFRLNGFVAMEGDECSGHGGFSFGVSKDRRKPAWGFWVLGGDNKFATDQWAESRATTWCVGV